MPAAALLDSYLEEQQRSANAAVGRASRLIPKDSRVGDAMRYALAGGGKRLRPVLCSAVFEAVAGARADERIADLGCAIELIHTYSLVHDDLPCMDDDDIRRGRATVHRIYGDDVAMLAGAALIPLAFRVALVAARELGLGEMQKRAISVTLATAAGAGGMVGGQVMDLEGESSEVGLETLHRIHAAKTGTLLGAACAVGAIAARASAAQLAAIAAFGRHLGLAFQITDDILDETASSAQLGKTAGKDRGVAKATFPAHLGLASAAQQAEAEMTAAIEVLESAHLDSEILVYLCRFAVERKR